MVIDEYISTGGGLKDMRRGLVDMGYDSDKIVTDYMQKEEDVFNDIMVTAIFNKKTSLFDVRRPEVEHAVLKNKKAVSQFRDTAQQISDMMLESLEKNKT